jgi:GNAT superfamily N-acetyltransferase
VLAPTKEDLVISIRPAGVRDVDVLKGLIYEMAEYEHLPAVITVESLARDGFGPQPEFYALIAEWEGAPAGYAFFFHCYSTFRGRGLFLEDVFVRSQFRGKKIGDALFARVAAIARAENCFGIRMNVLDWNRPAVEFFQKHKVKFLDGWMTACLDGEALQAIAEEA